MKDEIKFTETPNYCTMFFFLLYNPHSIIFILSFWLQTSHLFFKAALLIYIKLNIGELYQQNISYHLHDYKFFVSKNLYSAQDKSELLKRAALSASKEPSLWGIGAISRSTWSAHSSYRSLITIDARDSSNRWYKSSLYRMPLFLCINPTSELRLYFYLIFSIIYCGLY